MAESLREWLKDQRGELRAERQGMLSTALALLAEGARWNTVEAALRREFGDPGRGVIRAARERAEALLEANAEHAGADLATYLHLLEHGALPTGRIPTKNLRNLFTQPHEGPAAGNPDWTTTVVEYDYRDPESGLQITGIISVEHLANEGFQFVRQRLAWILAQRTGQATSPRIARLIAALSAGRVRVIWQGGGQ